VVGSGRALYGADSRCRVVVGEMLREKVVANVGGKVTPTKSFADKRNLDRPSDRLLKRRQQLLPSDPAILDRLESSLDVQLKTNL
jgi:hypothetical protein